MSAPLAVVRHDPVQWRHRRHDCTFIGGLLTLGMPAFPHDDDLPVIGIVGPPQGVRVFDPA